MIIDNIKEIWSGLTPENKNKVIAYVAESEEFEVGSEIAIKQNWIYQKRMPEKYQKSFLKIVQNALSAQLKEGSKLLDS